MPTALFSLASTGPFVSTISSPAGFPPGSQATSLPFPVRSRRRVKFVPTLLQRLAPTAAFALVLATLELSLSWQRCFGHVIALWQHLGAFALACRRSLTATPPTLPATAATASPTPPPALSTPPTP